MQPTHRPPTHPGEMLLKEFLEPCEHGPDLPASIGYGLKWGASDAKEADQTAQLRRRDGGE